MCGTPVYLAPEILSASYDGRKADCWSLGLVILDALRVEKTWVEGGTFTNFFNGVFHAAPNLPYIEELSKNSFIQEKWRQYITDVINSIQPPLYFHPGCPLYSRLIARI
jgi:serine/threonine protein kinase